MINESGYSSQRGLISGRDQIDDVVKKERTSTPLPHFPIAVVIDVLHDPLNLTEDEKQNLKDKILNPELIDRIPRNSIVASVITREVNKSDDVYQIFFPCNVYDVSPIKPGEQVFVFFSDPYRSTQIGYWFCRVPEPIDVDDICFTHGDRRFEYNEGLSSSEKFENEELSPPGFLNGDGLSEDSLTMANSEDFEKINKEAKSNKLIIKEPVARFTKRPGDKVIMGSNGTRIVLGMDRPGSSNDLPNPLSPTIDLVAHSYENLSEEQFQNKDPLIVKNSRGEFEVDKNPKKRKKNNNQSEGDPDFEVDKSRLYISAKTEGDQNFSISVDGDSGEGPYIVLKTDHARIIAREDLKIVVGDENGCSIVMKSNGDIVFTPGTSGIIKLGGEDANLGILGNTGVNAGGTVVSIPIVSTMGGGVGLNNSSQGFFAKKVLIK